MSNYSRITELLELKSRAETIDISVDEHFRGLIREARTRFELTDAQLGDDLAVSRPTISRWISGSSSPHTAMRKAVARWIAERAAEKIKNRQHSGGSCATPHYAGTAAAKAG